MQQRRRLLVAGGVAAGAVFVWRHEDRKIRGSSAYWSLASSASRALKAIDAETAHNVALGALRLGFGPIAPSPASALRSEVWGVSFASPVGVAAGFDKRGVATRALGELGFGFVEVGGVTLEPHPGNPRPRIFRAGEAIVNRVGLPSEGAEVVAKRLEATNPRTCVVGVNVAKRDAVSEYASVARRFSATADFLVVNASCPNVAGGLVDVSALPEILGSVRREIGDKPLLAKVSPDLGLRARRAIADALLTAKVDGIVVANTTTRRPGDDDAEDGPPKLDGDPIPDCPRGGLSGPPLTAATRVLVSDLYDRTRLPIVGVGGVRTPEDAYALIRAGAALVQVYTALAAEGPALATHLNTGLLRLAKKDGFRTVAEAVGADHRRDQ
ncbi:hypothetical protein CTAYLR_010636 [Chrysophaeum taylorii]|uniref:Dihydroorotate dehydrogenase (quinone), mitochondrial n=1 Tax=Chrysophaeum taylorii TaxID=2483200 RepID=A0AAD7XQ56_9STRA|nr:hypothetical protein CTAYLR_010636 [Chrysophaeum taylorii]